MYITILEQDYSWLVNYCRNQCKEILTKETPYWERYAITSYDQYMVMHYLYAILCDGIYCGFAIVPKYQTNILSSLYIDPKFRSNGAASFVIDNLKITKLSCISKNLEAMKVYEKLGFQIILDDSNMESVKLERKL